MRHNARKKVNLVRRCNGDQYVGILSPRLLEKIWARTVAFQDHHITVLVDAGDPVSTLVYDRKVVPFLREHLG